MSIVRYVPTVVREGKFEGHVVVKQLSFDERYDLLEKGAGEDNKVHYLKFMREVVRVSKDRYVEVFLKRKSDGREFKSFGDLEYGADVNDIRVEIAKGLLNGFDEGNG